jgi:CheY-like chemotaxis protein
MANILVIEDDEPVREVIKAMLESRGHVVTLAVNGDAGTQQFEQKAFDLVLCDVFMPQKEGLETMREIRQLSATVPIISMTGSGSEPDFLRIARAFGATHTIAKPFRMADLWSLVRQCLHPPGSC